MMFGLPFHGNGFLGWFLNALFGSGLNGRAWGVRRTLLVVSTGWGW